MKDTKKEQNTKISKKHLAENRKARHDYIIEAKYEAGIVLVGTEVKALRFGRANLKDSYAKIKNNEIFVYQLHIGPCPFTYYDNHDSLRPRKLLLHRREIDKLKSKIFEKGFTLIPLELYFLNGKAKIVIGLCKGKKEYDKRETIKKRDEKRELDRLKRHG